MTNKEAIEILNNWDMACPICEKGQSELEGVCVNCQFNRALDIAIKALKDATSIESITTKGGMTLSLQKTDIEISDLARCIATALKDITVEELANKYSMLTITDINSGKSVSYRRVDNGNIIHCKDCVFFGTDTYRGVKSYACFYYTSATLTVPEGFCHKARTTVPTEEEILNDVKSSIISVGKEVEK